ncbi:hypothetical protein JCM1841_005087 [Sporobolomyces salmonicolor]
MTATSPPSTATIPPTRPPARNKSSSALSTQTIRSLSATSTGKPRRNKSSASLAAHHHPAGHHAVSFAHHRKNSHGSHSMKRKDSKGSAFGLGMTSMTRADDEEGEHHADEERDGDRRKRPELGSRRSSSSSTVTVVGGRGRRQSSDTALERSRSRHREPSPPPQVAQSPEEERPLTVDTKLKGKEKISGSVTSTSDWESATDSPLAIGKKLPDVSRSFKTQGHSALSLAMDGKADEQPPQQEAQKRAPTPTRTNGKKPKFELVGSEDQDDEELASPPGIPSAAMPPAETPVLPAMPAVVEALVPTSSPNEGEKVPLPEYSQGMAAAMPPAPTSAALGMSPPEAQAGAPPPTPELTKVPPPLKEVRPPPEPTLAAANTDEPNMASALDKEYQQAHQGLTSAPRPSPTRPPSSRVPPTRKTSNASILSANSNRSMAPSLISRMGPQPHFRRTASGIAPIVDRAATARAEMASPSPDSAERERNEAARKGVVGERPESAHRRAESLSSMQSLRAAADATAPSRRANTFGPADAKRLRPIDTAGTALAALGNIAAASRPPSTDGTSTPAGALTHAKRSASGYFSSALRGLTSIPSALTPPISPSASASTRYPIPGATNPPPSSSYGRSGRSRSSPSPQQPPLIVKFLEPAPPAPHPPPVPASQVERSSSAPPPLSSSPAARHLSQQHRNSSSASLGPMSRTQQKALLARDAPYWGHHASSGSSAGAAAPPVSASSSLAPPPAPSPAPSPQGQLTPAQQQYLLLQQQRQQAAAASVSASSSSATSSPSPQTVATQQQNGMQKWAFGLVREAERIERQYRAVEKWRDPLGESLERVLARRATDRAVAMSANGGSSGSASAVGSGASTPLRGASQVGKVRAIAAA